MLVDEAAHGGTGGAGNSDNAAGTGGDGQGGSIAANAPAALLSSPRWTERSSPRHCRVRARDLAETAEPGRRPDRRSRRRRLWRLDPGRTVRRPVLSDRGDTGYASFGDLTSCLKVGRRGRREPVPAGRRRVGYGGDSQFMSYASEASASSLSLFSRRTRAATAALSGGDGTAGTSPSAPPAEYRHHQYAPRPHRYAGRRRCRRRGDRRAG